MDAMAYLEARAPFHFGLRGVGIEATTVHGPSDTVFAGLCQAMRQQLGPDKLREFLDDYDASPDPPLLLSSAFPYVLARREEEVDDWQPPKPFDPAQAICFFPRPLEPPPGLPDVPEERKKVKRIEWLSEGIFRAWVGGESMKPHYIPENLVQGGRVWLTAAEQKQVAGWRDEETDAIRLWAVGDVPRVTVDRQASTSTVYQAGRVWFPPGSGLWLLLRWRADWQAHGAVVLQVLGDAGIGGERSAGHGLFNLHGPQPLAPLPAPAADERFLTLSLYYPTETELPAVLSGEGVSYRLQMRRGWMASPDDSRDDKGNLVRGRALRRKAVRLFAEGSILRWPDGKTVLGMLADVTPEVFKKAHPVYRYGLAFPVGYRLSQGNKGQTGGAP